LLLVEDCFDNISIFDVVSVVKYLLLNTRLASDQTEYTLEIQENLDQTSSPSLGSAGSSIVDLWHIGGMIAIPTSLKRTQSPAATNDKIAAINTRVTGLATRRQPRLNQKLNLSEKIEKDLTKRNRRIFPKHASRSRDIFQHVEREQFP
jgi:hypothetical protein